MTISGKIISLDAVRLEHAAEQAFKMKEQLLDFSANMALVSTQLHEITLRQTVDFSEKMKSARQRSNEVMRLNARVSDCIDEGNIEEMHALAEELREFLQGSTLFDQTDTLTKLARREQSFE